MLVRLGRYGQIRGCGIGGGLDLFPKKCTLSLGRADYVTGELRPRKVIIATGNDQKNDNTNDQYFWKGQIYRQPRARDLAQYTLRPCQGIYRCGKRLSNGIIGPVST